MKVELKHLYREVLLKQDFKLIRSPKTQRQHLQMALKGLASMGSFQRYGERSFMEARREQNISKQLGGLYRI